MTPAPFDWERAGTIVATAAAVYVALAGLWFLRTWLEARETRRRLQQHQALAVEAERALTCQLCWEPHHRLHFVALVDGATWACDGCHAVLAGREVTT